MLYSPSWPGLSRPSRLDGHCVPERDCRVIGERSDDVLRTAMPGNDEEETRTAPAGIWLVPADAWRHDGLRHFAGAGAWLAGVVRPRRYGGGGGGLRVSADPRRHRVLGGMDHRRVHGGA